MADSYSVKATLSATDKGFSSTMKGALSSLKSLGQSVKGGFGFGMLAGAGSQAMSAITSGVSGLITEIDSSNAAWKTFDGNMKMLGKSDKDVKKVQGALQSFAQDSVYNSSDMASTYAQLAAVGVKSTGKLVTGFGGLAAAAENPKQAMKTLSQQATQMASKPTVAWQDFKLVQEQMPGSMAKVAEAMGMSARELSQNIQDGKVKTDDFFAAIDKVGNSKDFQDLARNAKTVGQSMDGLTETVANKLMPAFNIVSDIGIKAIDKIANKMNGIDGEAIASKLSAGIEKAKPYWDQFVSVLTVVGGALQTVGGFLLDNADTISKAIPWVLALVAGFKAFKILTTIAPGIKLFTSSFAKLAGGGFSGLAKRLFSTASAQSAVGKSSSASAKQIATSASAMLKLGAAVFLIAAGFALLAFSAVTVANAGGAAIAVFFGMVVALGALVAVLAMVMKGLATSVSPAKLAAVSTAMLAMGAAVLLVAAGFALLAYSAISLANAGAPAIAIMAGLLISLGLLVALFAALAPALTAGAVGFLAFGAAIVLVGAGAVLAAAALYIVAGVLPIIAQYGLQGALAIAALGAGMVAFAVGAAAAGVAAVVLGAGLVVVGAGLLVVGAALLIAAAGMALLAAGALALGASLMIVGAAVLMLGASLPMVSAGAMMASAGMLAMMGASVALLASLVALAAIMVVFGVSVGANAAILIAFGAAMIVSVAGCVALAAALTAVSSKLKSISSSAKSTQKSLSAMVQSVNAVEQGLSALGSKAKSALKGLISAFDNAASKAQAAGQKTGTGYANGMKPGLALAQAGAKSSTAKIIVVLNMAAVQAIASGKRLGTGYSNGVRSGMRSAVSAASSAVAQINSRLRSGHGNAYAAGAYISIGFASGMRSQLGAIRSAAAEMAAAADRAVRAKAKIHSPSRVAMALGGYWGEGYVIGISDMVRDAWHAAEKLVSVPNVAAPDMRLAYSGAMDDSFEYYRNTEYHFEIPVQVDGREVARATAKHTQEELNRQQVHENRKRGKV